MRVKCFFTLATLALTAVAHPLLAANLLSNPNFDDDTPPLNGNNVGFAVSNWSTDGAFNLVKDAGSAYSAPNYVDLTGNGTYASQQFTLASAGTVAFGAEFSPRDGGTGGGRVQIYDASNTTLVAGTPYVSATGANGPWVHSVVVQSLAAGTYTFRSTFDDGANTDSTFVEDASGVANGWQVTAVSGPGPYAPFTVSNSDLLQTSVSSVSSGGGNFALEGTGGVPILNNGQFSITGIGQNNPQLATVQDNGQNGSFVQYNLDLGASPAGYDISSLAVYGGWNDAGRDRQLYDISYTLVGSNTPIALASLNYDSPNGGVVSALKAAFSTSLTGVSSITFSFPNGQENTYAGIGELDVFGTPTVVPEPSGLLLAGIGAVMLGVIRRRSK